MNLRPRTRSEEGETLIELLITIIVLAIGGVAVVAAMTSSVLAADAHRSLATGEVVLRDYTEAIFQQAATIKGGAFVACPGVDDLSPPDGGALATGWTGTIEAIEYWIPNGANGSWGTAGDCQEHFDDLCGGAPPAAVAPSCAPGLEKLTVSVENPGLTDVSTKSLRGTTFVRRTNAP